MDMTAPFVSFEHSKLLMWHTAPGHRKLPMWHTVPSQQPTTWHTAPGHSQLLTWHTAPEPTEEGPSLQTTAILLELVLWRTS